MEHHPIGSMTGVICFGSLLALAGLAFMYALKMRFSQLMMGKRPDVRWDDIATRTKNVFIYVVAQKRLPKNGYLVNTRSISFITANVSASIPTGV